MKKFIHGRRHLRARRSVQAGREKRFIRKFNQNLKLLNSIDWVCLGISIRNIVEAMLDHFDAAAPIIQRELERLNGEIPDSLKIYTKILQDRMEKINGLS